jgi:DNA repair protein RecO (recombination protein O)
MKETVDVSGVVLYAQPLKEADKRLVILTRELGKITAFAHGARRQNSSLLAVTNPFVFAVFHMYEGKNAYTLVSADPVDYFSGLASKQPGVWIGFYFLELASYYGREGIESSGMVNLLYMALKALMKGQMSLSLIRRVYELRMMVENGDFAIPENQDGLDPTTVYALRFCAVSDVQNLFSFRLTEKAQKEFASVVDKQLKRAVDRPLKSLAVIEKMKSL